MEGSPLGSFLRGRRLESYFEAGLRSLAPAKPRAAPPRPRSCTPASAAAAAAAAVEEEFADDDKWSTVVVSVVRIVVCFVSMMVTTFIWAVVMVVLLPWPYARIRQGNVYGHVTGRMLVRGF